jgi:hypothetical protein
MYKVVYSYIYTPEGGIREGDGILCRNTKIVPSPEEKYLLEEGISDIIIEKSSFTTDTTEAEEIT